MWGGGGGVVGTGAGAGDETLWHPSKAKATANNEQTKKQRDEAKVIILVLKIEPDRTLRDRTAGIGLR
jgi:hypothetical protein